MHFLLMNSALRTFSIIETSREEADWGRNWTTAFYLDVKTSSFSHRVILNYVILSGCQNF
jgi:hypothetical protein